MTSARLLEERRRRRDRRDARERAYREWVCGGPLVDAFAPVIGGGDVDHPARVAVELERRAVHVQVEGDMLAVDFARRCCVTRRAEIQMLQEWFAWTAKLGKPGPIATHSTSAATPTTQGAIPQL